MATLSVVNHSSAVHCENWQISCIFPIGKSLIQFLVVDEGGNTDTCTSYVNVVDNQAPVIGACPVEIRVPTSLGVDYGVFTRPEFHISDNDVLPVRVEILPELQLVYPVGETSFRLTATDATGNAAICAFSLIVEGWYTEPFALYFIIRGTLM